MMYAETMGRADDPQEIDLDALGESMDLDADLYRESLDGGGDE